MPTSTDANEPKLTPPPTKVLWTAIVVSIVVLVGGAWLMGLLKAN